MSRARTRLWVGEWVSLPRSSQCPGPWDILVCNLPVGPGKAGSGGKKALPTFHLHTVLKTRWITQTSSDLAPEWPSSESLLGSQEPRNPKNVNIFCMYKKESMH